MIADSLETGIEQFVCMDSKGVSSEGYPKVELDNFLGQEIADKAKQYVELISDSGLIEHLSEPYFPIKHITIKHNICYVPDNTSQLTVYYDTVSHRIIGFGKNRGKDSSKNHS